MKAIINELRETFTVQIKDALYFRVEIYRENNGKDVQIGGYFAEVYMLRFPNGMSAAPSEKEDTSFRQQWVYLEDFPRVEGGSDIQIRPSVLAQIDNYAESYLKKFIAKVERQK